MEARPSSKLREPLELIVEKENEDDPDELEVGEEDDKTDPFRLPFIAQAHSNNLQKVIGRLGR